MNNVHPLMQAAMRSFTPESFSPPKTNDHTGLFRFEYTHGEVTLTCFLDYSPEEFSSYEYSSGPRMEPGEPAQMCLQHAYRGACVCAHDIVGLLDESIIDEIEALALEEVAA